MFGAGTLAALAKYDPGTTGNLSGLAVGDLNADGKPDVVVATESAAAVLLNSTP